jgi:hypothetical protein
MLSRMPKDSSPLELSPDPMEPPRDSVMLISPLIKLVKHSSRNGKALKSMADPSTWTLPTPDKREDPLVVVEDEVASNPAETEEVVVVALEDVEEVVAAVAMAASTAENPVTFPGNAPLEEVVVEEGSEEEEVAAEEEAVEGSEEAAVVEEGSEVAEVVAVEEDTEEEEIRKQQCRIFWQEDFLWF